MRHKWRPSPVCRKHTHNLHMGMNNNQTSCASVSAALHQSCMKYRSHHYPCNYLSRQTYRKDNNRACVQEKSDMVCLLARTKKDEPYPLAFFTDYIIFDTIRTIRTIFGNTALISCESSHMTDNHRLSCSLASSPTEEDTSI